MTPAWREPFDLTPDYCLHCGLEVRERFRLTTAERRLNSGIWYHVASEYRLCDPDSPKDFRGPKAYPKREIR